MTHNFDWLTRFCMKCGCGEWQALELQIECTGAENIIAISHRVRASMLRKLEAAI